MLGLTREQRAMLAEKLLDLGNLFVGGFVIARALDDRPLSWSLLAIGLFSWLGFIGVALFIARQK